MILEENTSTSASPSVYDTESEILDSFDKLFESVTDSSIGGEPESRVILLFRDSSETRITASVSSKEIGFGKVDFDGRPDHKVYFEGKNTALRVSTASSQYFFSHNSVGSTVQNVLYQTYVQSAMGDDAKAMKALFVAIEESFSNGDLEFVDLLLEDFDPRKVKGITSIAVLRGTFRARTHLKHWSGFLARVAFILVDNGQPASHMLRGLYNNNGRPLLARKHSV